MFQSTKLPPHSLIFSFVGDSELNRSVHPGRLRDNQHSTQFCYIRPGYTPRMFREVTSGNWWMFPWKCTNFLSKEFELYEWLTWCCYCEIFGFFSNTETIQINQNNHEAHFTAPKQGFIKFSECVVNCPEFDCLILASGFPSVPYYFCNSSPFLVSKFKNCVLTNFICTYRKHFQITILYKS